MDSDDKDRTKKRHLRGMAKFEERKQNLDERRKRGTRRATRMRDLGAQDDEDDEDFVEANPVRRSRKAAVGGHAVTPNARVSEVARTQVKVLGLEDAAGIRRPAERVVHLSPSVIAQGGVVVGDEVEVGADARVTGRAERRSVLQRRSPGQGRVMKVLAANVDLGCVVLAPRGDQLSLGFLDRAIVALEAGGVVPVIVVTKTDLQDEEGLERLHARLEPWTESGRPVHFVSSTTLDGVDALRSELEGQVAVCLGHSGVGKSTLVNALDPQAGQLTGVTREADGRGRHTTTASRLVPWGLGGALVDTPGVRQLAPEHVDIMDLARSVPELAPFLGQCRFDDCAHTGEPGCRLEEEAEASSGVRRALDRFQRLVDGQSMDP